MFGDERSRNTGLPLANLKAVSDSLRFYSTHLPSRTQRNSLKTRPRCHRYPSQFRDLETAPMRCREIDSAGRRG